jgi:four helix bundle protein
MTHKDLDLWKDSIQFVLDVYKATSGFPKEELFGLVSQLKRAAVSVPANISEGAGRTGPKEFSRFLQISLGSLSETETLLIIAKELGYLNAPEYENLAGKIKKLTSQIHGLIKALSR